MMKRAILATALSLAASAALASDAETLCGDGLAPEVAAGLERLRQHGDRFDAAIRLIEAEAQKPDFTGATCRTAMIVAKDN